MENKVSELKDFYIDLDGDIKAATGEFVCTFVTETNKLDSKYVFAQTMDEIKDAVKLVNPSFVLDINVFKQYSVKTNKQGEIKAIKVFTDYADAHDGLDMILMGIELNGKTITKDFYFFANEVDVNKFIQDNNLVYQVMKYDTHTAVLYSVKYDMDTNNVINFKTYYVPNETAVLYTKGITVALKESLRF